MLPIVLRRGAGSGGRAARGRILEVQNARSGAPPELAGLRELLGGVTGAGRAVAHRPADAPERRDNVSVGSGHPACSTQSKSSVQLVKPKHKALVAREIALLARGDRTQFLILHVISGDRDTLTACPGPMFVFAAVGNLARPPRLRAAELKARLRRFGVAGRQLLREGGAAGVIAKFGAGGRNNHWPPNSARAVHGGAGRHGRRRQRHRQIVLRPPSRALQELRRRPCALGARQRGVPLAGHAERRRQAGRAVDRRHRDGVVGHER